MLPQPTTPAAGAVMPATWARTPRRPANSAGSSSGVAWTQAEVRALTEMAGKVKAHVIAQRLGRTHSSIRGKAGMLGLGLRLPAKTQPLIVPDASRSRRIFSGCPQSMRAIIIAVSKAHGVPMENMLSESRLRPTVLARREMIWTVARDTKLSAAEIGRRLRLDHTSILHAIRRQNDATGENVRKAGGVSPCRKEAQQRFFAKRRAAA